MANICYYEIHARGPKRNVLDLGCMIPDYSGDKEILYANGTEDDYLLWFKGDCKWELDAYCGENPNVTYEPDEDDDIDDDDLKSYFENFFDKEMYIPMRQKSEILQIEIFALSVDSGGFFVNIDHYDKGKILSSVNILEEETHIDLLKEFSIDPENVEESAWDRVRSLPTKEESDGYRHDEENKGELIQASTLANLQAGDTFQMGRYPQANGGKKAPIDWLVLDKKGGKLLVISKFILDYQPFHGYKQAEQWGSSRIRNWLHEVFLKEAFFEKEQSLICETNIISMFNDGVEELSSDKLFLLSDKEVKKYFKTAKDRRAECTVYAKKAPGWGLRSYKLGTESFQAVYYSGRIISNGFSEMNHSNFECVWGVRPAMWLCHCE